MLHGNGDELIGFVDFVNVVLYSMRMNIEQCTYHRLN